MIIVLVHEKYLKCLYIELYAKVIATKLHKRTNSQYTIYTIRSFQFCVLQISGIILEHFRLLIKRKKYISSIKQLLNRKLRCISDASWGNCHFHKTGLLGNLLQTFDLEVGRQVPVLLTRSEMIGCREGSSTHYCRCQKQRPYCSAYLKGLGQKDEKYNKGFILRRNFEPGSS